MTANDFKKWLAVGTGIGIEIGREDLLIAAVRVRPSGVKVLGELVIHRFREQPASEWGADYSSFLKKLGLTHLAASVLLPRDEVMVRQLMLPGVADRDLGAAIRFELDSLNPYSEEEAVFDWARVGKSASILIGITRRSVLAHYNTLFAGAGIKVASFTFSAPAIYSALRALSSPSADGFLAVEETEDELEVYGESPTRPLFSARVDGSAAKARVLAVAELRLPPETEPTALHDALPKPIAAPDGYDVSRGSLAYATALAGACPLHALAVNLLPPEERRSSSRMRYVPTLTLAGLVLLMLGAVAAYPKYADREYLGLLHQEIRKLDPQARRAADLDRQITLTRNRAQTLDNFRRHTQEDMEALKELTQVLAPPTWLNSLQLTRDSVTIAGETEQAAALIKLLDSSRQFRGSSFALPLQRSATGELFSIRSTRQGVTP
jgi:Tfp pilus assembly protein PilN